MTERGDWRIFFLAFIEHLSFSIQNPVSSIEYRASSIQYPASSIEHPVSRIQYLIANPPTFPGHPSVVIRRAKSQIRESHWLNQGFPD
jgi:hypothetical protein